MNILFLDQFSQLGGAQKCLLDLLPGIRARGWTAHVAAPGNGPLLAASAELGATTSRLPLGSYSNGHKSAADVLHFVRDNARLMHRIRVLARECQADLAYVNGPRVLPAAALALRERLPVVFHCHSYLGRGYSSWLVRRSLGIANASVIACSEFVARPLRPLPGPLKVIYNGVGRGLLRRGGLRRDGKRRVGVIGRIAPEKGQAEFLKAARLIAGCEFVVCGAPLFSSPPYWSLVAKLATDVDSEFTGQVEDPAPVLAGLDILVVPSMAVDATPRVILEAWAAGVPVVAFDSGGIRELIEDGKTGFLVSLHTPEALASRVNAVLRDPREMGRVASEAYACWRDRFTVERYRAEVMAALQAARETAARGNAAAPGS